MDTERPTFLPEGQICFMHDPAGASSRRMSDSRTSSVNAVGNVIVRSHLIPITRTGSSDLQSLLTYFHGDLWLTMFRAQLA
jgi:hypothetical protein